MKIYRVICIILAVVLVCFTVSCGPQSDSNAGSGGGGESNGGNTVGNSPEISGNTGNNGAGESTGNSGAGNNGGAEDGVAGNNGNDNAGAENGGDGTGDGENNAGANLSGTPEEILGKLTDDLAATGIQMPMTIPPMKVEPEMSQNTIGLSEADFNKYVADCAYTMAAIGTFAHQMIVIQGTDAGAAGNIKKLVSGDNGYDAKKWICVFPEKAVAVESGVYVLIIAASAEVADAAVEIFKEAAGSTGEVNVFWEFAGEADGAAPGLAPGMGAPAIIPG